MSIATLKLVLPRLAVATLIGGTLGLSPLAAQVVHAEPDAEESILDKVSRTGKLVAGTRTDAIPLAFKDDREDWVGYSVDLLERIRTQVAQTLKKPVQLELVPVTARNRMSMLTNGEVDLVCGSESYTRSRAQMVDFSISYFVTSTQLMINPANTLGSEFRIGVVAGTTNQQLSQNLFQIAQFVQFDDRASGLAALERGRIDAFAGDGILLEGMRQTFEAAADFEIMPAQYDQEQYACMLPPGDLRFQEVVDAGLLEFMQGVLDGNPADLAVIETWFGETGVVPINLQPLLSFFQAQVDNQPVEGQPVEGQPASPELQSER